MLSLREKYIVDEKDKKTAIIIPFTEWKKVIDILEEYDDICAYDKARAQPSDPISFDDALNSLKDIDR